LCVELALPIVCPEESCGPIACPEELCEEGFEAPPAFSPKDSVVVPAKRAIASTAVAVLQCMPTLLILLRMLALSNAQVRVSETNI